MLRMLYWLLFGWRTRRQVLITDRFELSWRVAEVQETQSGFAAEVTFRNLALLLPGGKTLSPESSDDGFYQWRPHSGFTPEELAALGFAPVDGARRAKP